MNKLIPIIAICVLIVGIITVPTLSDQFADAKSRKKIHFTETIASQQDPGQGHEGHQIAVILSPDEGTLFTGSLTYTSSEPVQIAILHEIPKAHAKDQPTWTVDGETVYGLSLHGPNEKSGTHEFTGAAVALHSTNSKSFTATVSVDGWIRGQPTEVIMQQIEVEPEDPSITLSRASVPATIPLHEGIYNGEPVYYVITDSNDESEAEKLTELQGWRVEVAPPLSNTPEDVLETIYVFTDGIKGDGLEGFQHEVFSSTPEQTEQYSALRNLVLVTWKLGQNPELLDSEEKILEAKDDGRILVDYETGIILNAPQIKWPEGQMPVRKDTTLTNDSPYGEAQLLELNIENMTTTFVAHRGWGPDGRTIYYIVTDATPSGPAEMMGVSSAPSTASLVTSSAAVDLFQFENGIKGSGPLGFQPGIAAAALGDENYSPMWRIFIIEWNDEDKAAVLETKADIDAAKSEELISVSLAKPMNKEHIVNCPFIDPFQ